MDDSVGESIKELFEPMVNRKSGNIILIVGSSECGKSSILCKVLFQVFKNSNGFITTFMSPSYDSNPLKELIMKNVSENKKKTVETTADNPTGFKMSFLTKTKEWIMTKRGFDPQYCEKIYNTRLKLSKNYPDSDKPTEFRFCLALDDEIDIGGKMIRRVCLTWRNKGISWIQLVQDLTCFDCAVRNSAPIVFFGHMNFPMRRKQVCEEYLSPYIPGVNIEEKMDFYSRLTSEKRFILMNHRLRKAFHLDTHTGVCTELPELNSSAEMANGFYELQAALPIEHQKKDADKNDKKYKSSIGSGQTTAPVSSANLKSIDIMKHKSVDFKKKKKKT